MSSETSESAQAPRDLGSDQNKYAPTAWNNDLGEMEDLRVPSGQLCLVRRCGVQGLMEAGILENVDTLTAVVQKSITRAQGKKPQDRRRKGQDDNEITDADMTAIMKDPKGLAEVLEVVNKAVMFAVVEPKLYETPDDPKEMKPDRVYIHKVDLNDRMFIFNFVVGGTRDLETFRQQSAESLGSVEAQPKSRRKTK